MEEIASLKDDWGLNVRAGEWGEERTFGTEGAM